MPKIAVALINALLLWVPGVSAADTKSTCPTSVQNSHTSIATATAAIAAAKPELERRYSPQQVARYEPYTAKLQAGVWHVQGHLPTQMLGGTPEATVCQSTGKVLSVYHSQ